MRVVVLLRLGFLLACAVLGQGYKIVVCPPSSQQTITANRSLLPLANIVASSEDPVDPAEDIITNGFWCSSVSDASTVSGQHVNFTFTEAIVLLAIQSSGRGNSYVNNFTFEYAEEDDFVVYRDTESPQSFLIPQPAELFVLEPVVATKLRFIVDDGVTVNGNTCWGLFLLGCTLTEAEVLGTTCTPAEMTTPFSCPTPTMMPCPEVTCSPPSTADAGPLPPQCPTSACDEVELTLEKLLVLVVPSAVGTILIVAVIAAVGVVICIKCWKRGKYQSSSRNSSKIAAQNPCAEGSQRREAQNTLYEDTNLRPEDVIYEPIPDGTDLKAGYSVPFHGQHMIKLHQNECYTETSHAGSNEA